MRRVHLRITGRVQGVYYRANTRETAQGLGLRGWVRNLRDGSVEACAEGPQEQLEAFIEWCKEGPPAARVDSVDATWGEASEEFERFEIRY